MHAPDRHWRWHALCAGLVLLATDGTSAQTPFHRVVPGETLSSIARQHSGDAGQWRRLQALNAVRDPHHLAPDTVLRLPADWPTPAWAEIEHVVGEAYLEGGRNTPRVRLTPGMRPAEGQLLLVPADSSVTLRLADGSSMQLAPGTRIRLDRLRTRAAGASGAATDARWTLHEGRVDNQVVPPALPGRRFEIRTPHAVASVRGTEFGVAVDPSQGTRSEVYRGRVEVRGARGAAAALVPGQGVLATRLGVGAPRPLPAAPELAGPLGDGVLGGPTLALPLPTAPAGMQWRVRVLPADPSNAANTTVLREHMTAGPQARLAPLPAGDYRVALQLRDPDGLLGPASVHPWRVLSLPPPPLYLSPPADARVSSAGVELACTHPEGVSGFVLQLATQPDFNPPLLDLKNLATCHHQASLAPGRYHWRAASIARTRTGQAVQGPFGATQTFERLPDPPAAPRTHTEATASGVRVRWEPCDGCRYRVQRSAQADFSPVSHDAIVTEAELLLPDTGHDTVFLRVAVVDASGREGPFSTTQAVQAPLRWRANDGQPWRSADAQPVSPAAPR